MGDKVRDAEERLDDFLVQFDEDERERLIRYALDHIVPKLKALASPPQEQAPGWMPIETAPKDAYVLCTGHEGNEQSQPRWVEKGITNGGLWFDGNGLELYPPTHWMPLPAAPSQEQAKGRV